MYRLHFTFLKFLLVVFCFSIPNYAVAQWFIVKDLNDFHLKGNVKSVVEKKYNMPISRFVDKNRKLVEQHQIVSEKTLFFNKKGTLISEFEKGTSSSSTSNFIFKNDLLIEINLVSGYSKIKSIQFKYNNKDKFVERKTFEWGSPVNIYTLTYDKYGKPQNSTYSDILNKENSHSTYNYSNDNLQSYVAYEDEVIRTEINYYYDNRSRLLKEVYISYKEKQIDYKSNSYYDKKGVLIKEDYEYYKNGSVLDKKSVVYKNGLEINNTYYNTEEKTKREKLSKYSKSGNILFCQSSIINSENKVSEIYSEYYKYNNKSTLIELKTNRESLQDEYEIISYKYKYDEKLNWIIKCKKSNGVPWEVTLRNIVYFNSEKQQIISKDEALMFCDPLYKEKIKEAQQKIDANNGVREIEEH